MYDLGLQQINSNVSIKLQEFYMSEAVYTCAA
jgi:hypothetical protein